MEVIFAPHFDAVYEFAHRVGGASLTGGAGLGVDDDFALDVGGGGGVKIHLLATLCDVFNIVSTPSTQIRLSPFDNESQKSIHPPLCCEYFLPHTYIAKSASLCGLTFLLVRSCSFTFFTPPDVAGRCYSASSGFSCQKYPQRIQVLRIYPSFVNFVSASALHFGH